MKNPIHIVAVAAALIVPTSLFAGEECCPAAKASSSTAQAGCCSAKGQQVLLKIKASDAAALDRKLAALEGVTEAHTCPDSKYTKINFNTEKVCSDKLMTAIGKAGLSVEAQRVTYAIDGMSCGACSDKVTKALSKVKGVSDAKVCQESKQAVVEFNPKKVSAEKVLAAIDATGFKASPVVN
jgi:copper ion binding protein